MKKTLGLLAILPAAIFAGCGDICEDSEAVRAKGVELQAKVESAARNPRELGDFCKRYKNETARELFYFKKELREEAYAKFFSREGSCAVESGRYKTVRYAVGRGATRTKKVWVCKDDGFDVAMELAYHAGRLNRFILAACEARADGDLELAASYLNDALEVFPAIELQSWTVLSKASCPVPTGRRGD